MPGPFRPSISRSAVEVDVQTLPIVVGPEIGQPGLGGRFGVQRFGIQRAVGGHLRHQVADLVDLGAESRLGQVVELYGSGSGLGHGDIMLL